MKVKGELSESVITLKAPKKVSVLDVVLLVWLYLCK